jgi:hypothetical protein
VPIYKAMIDARPGTALDRRLLPAGRQSTAASVPRIFSTMRAKLDREIAGYYAHRRSLERRIEAYKPLDFSCSRVALSAQLGAALNALPTTHRSTGAPRSTAASAHGRRPAMPSRSTSSSTPTGRPGRTRRTPS